MKKTFAIVLSLLLSARAFAELPKSYVAVAGRGGSAVALLDSTTGELVKNLSDAETGFAFEPMYVSHLKGVSIIAVGDRKANQVLFFDDKSAEFLGTTPVSKGVFHQWHNPGRSQLAVVGDVDQTVDLLSLQRTAAKKLKIKRQVFNVPQQYHSGVPHDVVLGDAFFYVSIKGADINGKKGDYLLQVDRKSMQVVNQLVFSADIHLGYPQNSPYLLVVEQAAGKLTYVDKMSLQPVNETQNLNGAHGIFWAEDAGRVFVANITAAMDNAIFELQNPTKGMPAPVVSSTAATSQGAVHNLVADFDSKRLFATHSGAQSTAVSVYDIGGKGVKFVSAVSVPLNPFGIAIIKR